MPGQSKSLDRTDAPAVATAVAVEDLPTRVGGPCCRVIGKGAMERRNDRTTERSNNDNATIGGAKTKREERERSGMKDN